MSYSVRQNPAHSSNYTKGRTQKVNKIVDHHAATTDFDGIGRTFRNKNRNASAHYGVGRNGNVDQYVAESDMAWHAGTKDPKTNPNPSSIGIEHVNKKGAPSWEIDEQTFKTTIELHYDIAKRHGLLPLVPGKNLFQHKNFAATYCAGRVGDNLQRIADGVNAMANGNAPKPKPTPKPDQVLHVGERFQFKRTYKVDNMMKIGGIWQVQTKLLCPVDFSWNDNGLPVMPLVEVDSKGNKTKDQALQRGSLYKIPGTYTVLDLGVHKGRWLAKVKMQGWTVWVDIATVTEV